MRALRGPLLAAAMLCGSGAHAQPAAGHRYDAIAIMQPHDEATVFDNNGHVELQVRISPTGELAPGDRIELFLDQRPVTLQHAAGPQTLEHVERGSHRLQARIVDRSGHTVLESQPVTFYLWQASRNFPSRR
jgi:hypothetical protein